AKAVELNLAFLLHYKAAASPPAFEEKVECWGSDLRLSDQRRPAQIPVGGALVLGPDLDDAFGEYTEDARQKLAPHSWCVSLLKEISKRSLIHGQSPRRCGSFAKGGLP